MHEHGAWEAEQLAELRHHWGEAYDIFADRGDRWRARRRDGRGAWLVARDPEQLLALLRADYQRDPVSRDER